MKKVLAVLLILSMLLPLAACGRIGKKPEATPEPVQTEAPKIEITSQPKSVTATAGDKVSFHVAAEGEDLQYQWQYRTSSSGSWKNSTVDGCKTATLTVTATAARNGYQYRCKVSNSLDKASSKSAKLTVESAAEAAAKKFGSTSLDEIKAAADGGDAMAMLYLGDLYAFGQYQLGVSRNFKTALKWYRKAAKAGCKDPELYLKLAKMYESGAAGEKDLDKAYEWYGKAAKAGNAEAKTAMKQDIFDSARWKAGASLLKGHLGEREMVNGGLTMPFYLDTPVVNCGMVSLDLRIVTIKNGWPFGGYSLWAQDLDGRWVELGNFEIEKSQENGGSRTYEFALDAPLSFKALAVCLSESGMEFGLVHEDKYYVEKSCISSYSDAVPAPVFVASDLEYPELSASVSSSMFVNPYG